MKAKRYMVTRDVAIDAPHNFADRDVRAGEILYGATVVTHGCVDTTNGIAATWDSEGGYPFFEFPRDAVEAV